VPIPASAASIARGLIIGFAIAAPVGPVGALCIRRTLAAGRTSGFISGLGAATADALYAATAAFGLTSVSSELVERQSLLHLVGGIFLLYLGLRVAIARPAEKPELASGGGLIGAYASTFFLTVTNPMTILLFAAFFTSLGVTTSGGSYGSAALLTIGVFLGSAIWWLLLSAGVGAVRDRLTPAGLQWVNRAAGVFIAAFGVIALVKLAR